MGGNEAFRDITLNIKRKMLESPGNANDIFFWFVFFRSMKLFNLKVILKK